MNAAHCWKHREYCATCKHCEHEALKAFGESLKKRTFEEPPLLKRSASNELLSSKAIAEMFRADAEKIHENWKAFEAHRRVAELRKSCGVKPDKTSTINIRRPPRYQSK